METLVSLKEQANRLYNSGSFRQAVILYDQCLLHPEADDSLRCLLHSNKAQAYLKMGNFKNALNESTKALNINPTDVKALFRRAQASEKLGRLQLALEDVRRLIRLNPKNKAAQDLARRIEMIASARVTEAESLQARIKSMLELIQTESKTSDKLESALTNLTALVIETGPTASSMIWEDPAYSSLVALCDRTELPVVKAAHRLVALTFQDHSDRCMFVLEHLTPQYFFDRILSQRANESIESCRFLNAVLQSLTQLDSYNKAKEMDALNTSKETGKVAPVAYPRFTLDPTMERPVFNILHHLSKTVNSYRLSAAARDYIIEMLIRFVPSEKGIGCSQRIIKSEDLVERLLEVGGAAGTSALGSWRSRRSKEIRDSIGSAPDRGTDLSPLHTSPNTRMTVACLLAKLWEDLGSDSLRESFTATCSDFIMELFADHYLETKVEAASVIGTLFLGPHDVGASILSKDGVLQGLFLLTQCPNMLYQTIALDTIILATHKKDQCLNLVSKAVPILRNLYKSENDGTKVRALVALCKFSAAGGADASVRSLTEGSASLLLQACRRLLLDCEVHEIGLDDVTAVPQPTAEVTELGELIVNEEPGCDDLDSMGASDTTMFREKMKTHGDPTLATLAKNPETVRWVCEGIACLSLNAEVKQEIMEDTQLIKALLQLPKLHLKDCGFALASVFANLTNCMPRTAVEPEMLELAKFAKQHIPEEHPLDAKSYVSTRRQTLIDAGLPTALFDMTIYLSDGPTGGQTGLRELISRLYLCISEEVSIRGRLVQLGATKALLNLALKSNSDTGKLLAAQTLARLAITADPRVTFPGQKSLELVRPLLQLISPDCDALQNFEGLLALTNLASLDDRHRHRIMAERGVPLIDHHMFEDHVMLRRAAVECVANMAQYHAFVVCCGGTLPLEDGDLGAKLPFLRSATERVKLLVLYCCEFQDLLLVRAAIGALATMSYDLGIISLITKTSTWFETIQTLAGHDACEIQHRATHLLRNMVVHGQPSFREYVCKSTMLEVLMSLSQLPQLSSDDSIPQETLSMNPGISHARLREMMIEDRRATVRCASEALRQLHHDGLVKQIPGSLGTG